jgi:CRP/FNR family transcriptional regulator, cyclic AMP receptor protein
MSRELFVLRVLHCRLPKAFERASKASRETCLREAPWSRHIKAAIVPSREDLVATRVSRCTVPSDRKSQPEVSEKSALFGRHPLFRELGHEIRDRLGAYATTKNVSRGKTVFSKGDPGTCLFAVWTGAVEIMVPSSQGKSAVFNLVREGEIFGEVALLDGGPRTADAVAFTECKLLAIERRDFLSLLRLHPDVSIRLIQVLCARLRQTTEQVEDLMFLDLKRRLIKTLLRLSKTEGCDGRIVISQSKLSEIVGLSREMINKQLQVWAADGWIRLERRCITVLRADALTRIVEKEKD